MCIIMFPPPGKELFILAVCNNNNSFSFPNLLLCLHHKAIHRLKGIIDVQKSN